MIGALTGNGRILLTVDRIGRWNDLYYPHPGEHQHLAEARLGLYDVDQDKFAWLDEVNDTVGAGTYVETPHDCRAALRAMGVNVEVEDQVHPDHDVIIRTIGLKSEDGQPRRLRVFQYQNLSIGGSTYQTTAYWDKTRDSIIHYRGEYYFQFVGRPNFDAFTTGQHTIHGLEGSHRDAEDGKLEGNPISHGTSDSVVQWDVDLGPGEKKTVHLFVLLGHSRRELERVEAALPLDQPERIRNEAGAFEERWLAAKHSPLPVLSEHAREIFRRSIYVLQTCTSREGSIIASPDSRTLRSGGDTYNYCWWRDGAYISRAMGLVGMHRHAWQFLRFGARCQEPEGYFAHRHTPDGNFGSTWHPPPFLQLDQTGSMLVATWDQYRASNDIDELKALWPMVKKAADYLEDAIDDRGIPLVSYDLWEEREAVNCYSVGVAIQGLRAANRIGSALGKDGSGWYTASERITRAARDMFWNEEREAPYKSLDPMDATIDASVLMSHLYEPDDERFAKTVDTVERTLWVPETGGISRYEGDEYYGPMNPWLICTLWLAQSHLALGRHERARELVEWVARQATPTGLLPEQLERGTGRATSVIPLVWSHSTFIETCHMLQAAADRAGDGAARPRTSSVGPDRVEVTTEVHR